MTDGQEPLIDFELAEGSHFFEHEGTEHYAEWDELPDTQQAKLKALHCNLRDQLHQTAQQIAQVLSQ